MQQNRKNAKRDEYFCKTLYISRRKVGDSSLESVKGYAVSVNPQMVAVLSCKCSPSGQPYAVSRRFYSLAADVLAIRCLALRNHMYKRGGWWEKL
jgi:hypothetical protein